MASPYAGIQYHGEGGTTQACVEAVVNLIQSRHNINSALILTFVRYHCLLLNVRHGDTVAIKAGFTSGYSGEGPRGFSLVLGPLKDHGVEIEEIDVEQAVLDRIDQSALTTEDLSLIEAAHRVRPKRLYDYISPDDFFHTSEITWRLAFKPVMPFAIIDPRIHDLAKSFWDDPDSKLVTGYRRLEDIVRKRTGLRDNGTKLFSGAFMSKDKVLEWLEIPTAEQEGRGLLFNATIMAFRNARAHRELPETECDALVEFLQLNQLYLLEGSAKT